MSKYYQGRFAPKNPQKYKGDPTKIIARSSWEFKFMIFADSHPDIIEWASEEIAIPYLSPVDNRIHRYFPDVWIKKRDKAGKIKTIMIEIKPLAQTIEPVKKTKINKRYIQEVYNWGINTAKWEAAKKYCDKRGWDFEILTERELNIKV